MPIFKENIFIAYMGRFNYIVQYAQTSSLTPKNAQDVSIHHIHGSVECAEDDILRQAQSFTAGENITEERKKRSPAVRANSWVIHAFGRAFQRQKTDARWTSVFWRRRRDSNSCYGFPYYSLSRGAPWASWVLLHGSLIQKLYYYITFFLTCQSFFPQKRKNF